MPVLNHVIQNSSRMTRAQRSAQSHCVEVIEHTCHDFLAQLAQQENEKKPICKKTCYPD